MATGENQERDYKEKTDYWACWVLICCLCKRTPTFLSTLTVKQYSKSLSRRGGGWESRFDEFSGEKKDTAITQRQMVQLTLKEYEALVKCACSKTCENLGDCKYTRKDLDAVS